MPEAAYPILIERATEPPGNCIITGDIDGPFIDTGRDIIDPSNYELKYRVYIHAPYVEFNLARDLLGMVSKDDVKALEDERDDLQEQLDALQMAFDALTNAKKEVPA